MAQFVFLLLSDDVSLLDECERERFRLFVCVCAQGKQDGQSSAFTYREERAQRGDEGRWRGNTSKKKGTENRKEVRENVM